MKWTNSIKEAMGVSLHTGVGQGRGGQRVVDVTHSYSSRESEPTQGHITHVGLKRRKQSGMASVFVGLFVSVVFELSNWMILFTETEKTGRG